MICYCIFLEDRWQLLEEQTASGFRKKKAVVQSVGIILFNPRNFSLTPLWAMYAILSVWILSVYIYNQRPSCTFKDIRIYAQRMGRRLCLFRVPKGDGTARGVFSRCDDIRVQQRLLEEKHGGCARDIDIMRICK